MRLFNETPDVHRGARERGGVAGTGAGAAGGGASGWVPQHPICPRFTIPFLQGLKEAGYVVGQNVAVEYRWGDDHYDRLPALADDLVRRRVAVIIALTTRVALAAKAATKSIPIAFSSGSDPVDSGLVASLNRPGGNLTGFYSLIDQVQEKRLELLRDMVPNASLFAYLDDPTNSIGTRPRQLAQMEVAAGTLGVRLLILNASEPSELEAAFATLVREGAGGLILSGAAFFGNHFDQFVALTTRHRVPAIFPARNPVEAGGLISYGTDFPNMYRRVGGYAGRILKGDKPADLPVQQVTKIEMVINLKTAKALGLTIPETLLATADEVIQ
jgi:putative ABC transport system substrate-binding protein